MKALSAAIVMLLAVALAACADSRRPTTDPATAPSPALRASVILAPANAAPQSAAVPVLYTEVAASSADRSRGLGGRETLGEDSAMLFVYGAPKTHRFWMMDCYLSLDIAFLDTTGRVLQIATLPPGIGKRGAAIPDVECPHLALYVLETNAGWMARNGLGVGGLVEVRAVVEGVRAE